jgi:hypothetical protein
MAGRLTRLECGTATLFCSRTAHRPITLRLLPAADWEKRWTISDWKKADGTAGDWALTAGDWWVCIPAN